MGPTKYYTVEQIKELRKGVDAHIQKVASEHLLGDENIQNKDDRLYDMASYQALVHLTNAKMWLGKMLEGRGNEFPPELADKAEI